MEGWVPASYLETEEDYEEMIKNEQMKLSQSSCELDHEIPEFTEQDQSQSATDEGHQGKALYWYCNSIVKICSI